MDLFSVVTTVPEFRGCKDVEVSWLVLDRKAPLVPYALGIAGYDRLAEQTKGFAASALDELFSENEAQALVAWLERERSGRHVITANRLPVEAGLSLSGLPVGGPQDFLMLSKAETWDLPFKAWGYYDLRGHEALPGEEDERVRALRRGSAVGGLQ